jgi:prevent-host-death family protein
MPPRVVNVHDAKTHLSRLLDQVHAGEEIILAKAGRPYARLCPVDEDGRRPLGFVPGSVPVDFDDPLPSDELRRWT